MSINRSYLTALGILAGVMLFFAIGSIFGGGGSNGTDNTLTEPGRFEVVTRLVHAETQPAHLGLRGRTEAFREVVLRAETGGRVVETPAIEGAPVAAGDVMCRLDPDARGAALSQAQADLRARQLDYDAAVELENRGHRSANQVAAMEAARDAAQAQMLAAREELANVHVRAPFDGYFDGQLAEIGDFLGRGDPCAVIVQLDPVLVVSEVAEREVARIEPGMTGHAVLATGEAIDGVIRFVERRADPVTRTFRIEMEAPNPDGQIRSGVTAAIDLVLAPEPAHRIPASILALNAEGILGVRIVEAGDIVRFVPIRLLSDDGEQVWVSGLPNPAQIITLGQEFVSEGTQVHVSNGAREAAGANE
jgi:multidrug efflux system membrane fusion protein